MVAVVQFDSVSLGLVESMLAAGRLRCLAELRARGCWLPLETPASLLAAATYPTLYSGLPAGEHGVYYPFAWSPGRQRVIPPGEVEYPETVWERLARAGRRSIVVDPSEVPPPRRPVGVFVAGFGFVNRVVLPASSDPHRAYARLSRRLGRAPHVDEVFGRPTLRGLARVRDRLVEAPTRVAAAALELLRDGPCDLLWIAFPAAHIAGHQLFDLSQLPAGDRARGEELGLTGALPEVYDAVDAAVGSVVASLPAEADVILLSPLGMEANASRVELLHGMVAAVLSEGSNGEEDGGRLWRLRAALPTGLRAAIAGALPSRASLELAARLATYGLDWGSTSAFALPADHHGYVRVNLRGRERDGIVEPRDLDALLVALAEGLLSFEDADGARAASLVERAQAAFPGRRAGLLPDLVVRWGDPPRPGSAEVRSRRYGVVRQGGGGSGRAGNHTADAFAVLVPGSSRMRAGAGAARIEDIVPTICSALGVEREGLPGEPLLAPAA